MTTMMDQFANHTYLSLAVASLYLEYVSHSSVQILLNDVWTGALKRADITSKECFLGIIFPPYILTFDFVDEYQAVAVGSKTDAVDGFGHLGEAFSDLTRYVQTIIE